MLSPDEITRLLMSHQNEIARWVKLDITSRVQLLNDVASGKHDDKDSHDNLYDDVTDAHDLIMSMLHSNAWNGESVDPTFWDTDMGRVLLNVRLWLDSDELITMTEAAEILRGDTQDRDLIWVNAQIKKGRLDAYTDLNEPNPQRARRVSRQQVELLKDE